MKIQIDEENYIIKCDIGKIEFAIDDESLSVFQVFTLRKRCGVCSSLVKKLEEFASQRRLRNIIVPATPSKQALSFWLKMGYCYLFPEDNIIGNQILNKEDPEEIQDTDSGVILLEKTVGGLL